MFRAVFILWLAAVAVAGLACLVGDALGAPPAGTFYDVVGVLIGIAFLVALVAALMAIDARPRRPRAQDDTDRRFFF